MPFPHDRPRRLRHSETLRRMVRETRLSAGDLISPIFICGGEKTRREIPSMPGVFQLSLDAAVEEAALLKQLGIPAAILFGVPERDKKNASGSNAWDDNGLVQQALRKIKAQIPGLLLIADACFCEYTEHGHCGVLDAKKSVDNDLTNQN